ncbi:unnamed protein product, partial [Durusdinium trenchii]
EGDAVPQEYQEGDQRPEPEDRACAVRANSQSCLVIQDVDLHLHFGSAEQGAALALSEEACCGRPAAALRVCARLTILEAE